MEQIRPKTRSKTEKTGESSDTAEEKASLGKITPPGPISNDHDLSRFCSGEPSLDDWLVQRAYLNHTKGFSKVFVICNDNTEVVGYYALSSYAIERKDAPDIRQAPNPIPAVLLGRLAVDQKYQGQGIGQDLMQDALKRIISAKENIGIKAIVVHALNEKVALYYKTLGFEEMPKSKLELFITVSDLEETFKEV